MNSDVGKSFTNTEDFKTSMLAHWKLYKYKHLEKDDKEYEVDKIVGKHIITHLQTFFNEKPKRSRSIRKKNEGKKNKTYKNKKYD
jgi:hypothetical protein